MHKSSCFTITDQSEVAYLSWHFQKQRPATKPKTKKPNQKQTQK